MKSMYLILSVLFLFTGCNKEEAKQQENLIYGTWQLVEVYSNIGNGENSWNKIENGYTYLIKKDNSFNSTKYNECSSGKLEINNTLSTISFIFECTNFYPCLNQSNSCVEYFSFEGDNLILSSTYQNCEEGCPQFKFKKVTVEK